MYKYDIILISTIYVWSKEKRKNILQLTRHVATHWSNWGSTVVVVEVVVVIVVEVCRNGLFAGPSKINPSTSNVVGSVWISILLPVKSFLIWSNDN